MVNDLSDRPIIGITIGDAAGIGPEIVLKSVSDVAIREICKPLIIADLNLLRKTASDLDIPIRLVSHESDSADAVRVFDLANLSRSVTLAEESVECGRAAGQYIEKAVELWKLGEIDAISTAPINKRSLALGGYDHPGHTEFLAALTGTKEFRMSFFAGDLRVVLISTHISLREAIDRVKHNALVDVIDFTSRTLSDLLSRKVRIAVAGLNPHASEGGMFGTEEADEMVTAIAYCRNNKGIEVDGPFSPDTIFLRGYRGEFDAVIACYHDQATIAVKSLSFGSAVNVTLGLPLIRTSVDHGTAFDIAGKGIADASSMTSAIRLAADLCQLSRSKASKP